MRAGASIIVVLAVAVGIAVWSTRVDAEEPSASPAYPFPGASDVTSDAAVVAAFDAPVEHPEALGVRVRDAAGADVQGALTFREDMTSVIFRPLLPLAAGEYDVEVGTRADGARIDRQMAAWSFTVQEPAELWRGPGGPILLVLSDDDPIDQLYAEILRAEGLTSFDAVRASEMTAEHLERHRVIILASGASTTGVDLGRLRSWADGGGDLVVMQPRDDLAAIAGIVPTGESAAEVSMRIDTSRPPGRGLPAVAMRVHGATDVVHVDPDVTVVATWTADDGSGPAYPLVTVRAMGGQGGSITAFTFDLAHSIMLTRQGNPQWAGQEFDGANPLRPNELFQGDDRYLDRDTIEIPVADEQSRLLSRMLEHATREDGPLPRLWYFPNGAEAVLVMAADDHGTGRGTQESFDRMLELSDDGCDVDEWECARATSWLYPWSGLTDAQAADYVEQGFDIGLHATTRCNNWAPASLQQAFRNELLDFWEAYPSVPHQQGSRLHCLVWSDYVSQPTIERSWGVRFDMNYSFWPPAWAQGKSGFLTGSGVPMRFVDPASGLIDVYQQETHFFDETFATSSVPVRRALERAVGPEQYFGAFGTHYDFHIPFDQELIDLARDLSVPMVSAQQMLEWTDGRGSTRVKARSWANGELAFTAEVDPRAESLVQTMLPVSSAAGELRSVRGPEGLADVEVRTVKGIEYAMFDIVSGDYFVTFGPIPTR